MLLLFTRFDDDDAFYSDVSDAFPHNTKQKKTRRKLSFRVSNPNFKKAFLSSFFSHFSLQRARALRVARASFRIAHTESFTHT